MRRLYAIVRVTLIQLIGRRRSIGLLILSALPAIILLLFALNQPDPETEEFFRTVILALILGVTVPITAILLGSSSLGDERQNKTISYIALRPIRKEAIGGAKLIATWLSSFLIAGVGAAAAGVVLGVTVGSWDEVGAILVASAITTAGFSAVFQLVGYITDRGVVVGLAYLLIWEGTVTSVASQVATTSMWRIGASAYAAMIAGDFWGSAVGAQAQIVDDLDSLLQGVNPGLWGAAIKMLVLALISVLVLAYLMRDRDLVK